MFKRADIAGDVTRTSASISESCGDFSTAVPEGCVIDSGYRGSPLLVWAICTTPFAPIRMPPTGPAARRS
ncbi:MAG: hypothetical protein WBV61_03885 [Rhodanobacteraceae bacterium]